MTLTDIQSNNEFYELIASLENQQLKYIVAYYYSPSCLQCKYIARPIFLKLYELYKDNNLISFIQIDTSNENIKEICIKCNVNVIPSTIIFEYVDSKIKCDMLCGKNIPKIIDKINDVMNIKKNVD